jgi:hypothetical protein
MPVCMCQARQLLLQIAVALLRRWGQPPAYIGPSRRRSAALSDHNRRVDGHTRLAQHADPAACTPLPCPPPPTTGVGFVGELSKQPSRRCVTDALKMLDRMSHRGACGCEENTGGRRGLEGWRARGPRSRWLWETLHQAYRARPLLRAVVWWRYALGAHFSAPPKLNPVNPHPHPQPGDGAGILVAMPDSFFGPVMEAQGVRLPPAGDYGVGQVFLPQVRGVGWGGAGGRWARV